MTSSIAAVRFLPSTRIQVELLRRLGRVRGIIVGCAAAALAIEFLQVKLAAAGAPTESLAGTRLTIVGLLALAWGASIWRGEAPKNRQYFLSHPVDASAHELSRVAAGAAWLIAAIAGSVVVAIISALVRRDAIAFADGPLTWSGLFTGSVLVYLVVSAIATLTGRVAEVLIIGYLGLVVLVPVLALTGIGKSVGKVFNAMIVGEYGLRAALVAPRTTELGASVKWILALAIWYAVAGAMFAAVLWWRRGRLASR